MNVIYDLQQILQGISAKWGRGRLFPLLFSRFPEQLYNSMALVHLGSLGAYLKIWEPGES